MRYCREMPGAIALVDLIKEHCNRCCEMIADSAYPVAIQITGVFQTLAVDSGIGKPSIGLTGQHLIN